ncbi:MULTISPECIES: helix-turn-helix transcriptional regulator [Microbacterium]|jgi:DNA-binding transcriptional ArsR family regulator|uniref:ArsR/SmtB family transcription factor n=1 Tax=Microbacterium TaxID=33882 RepID=UPI001E529177|nr:metalloregulator ArsR/SmtB family transcription factor [Microbacterium nymphoidis]MCD2498786.1 metalloregulator ArsR/SmtB family transcription factor [Microbacterium nymphoidis]
MADIFDVIADSTRREILRLLLDRSDAPGYDGTSVSQIVADLGISQPTVSKHLKVLRDAGLVTVREEGQHRFYSLDIVPMEEIEDWLMPFIDAHDDQVVAALPEGAVHAADFVGRTAAAITHAVTSTFRKRPSR